MSTVTTLLNLVKPAVPEQFSLSTYNNSLDAIDAYFKDVVAKMAKGRLNHKTTDAASVGLSNVGVITDYIPVTLVAGRYYTATYRVNSICSGAANMALNIVFRKSPIADVTVAGTDIDEAYTVWTAPIANSSSTHNVQVRWKAAASETVNIKAIMVRVTGAALYDISLRDLSVEDAGAQF